MAVTRGMSVFSHNGTEYAVNDPNIADEFSAGVGYYAGQYVNYQGKLYRFRAAHPAGAWNASQVQEVRIGEDIKSRAEEVDTMKKMSNEVLSLNILLDQDKHITSMFTMADMTPIRTISGYKLLDDGRCAADAGYDLLVYSTATEYDIYMNIPSLGGQALYQFQNSSVVEDILPNTAIVGAVYHETYRGYRTVPNSATYMVICVTHGTASTGILKRVQKTQPDQNSAATLFYPAFAIPGYVSNTGEFVDDTTRTGTWIRTDYIELPVAEGEYWEFYTPPTTTGYTFDWQYCAYYDENKQFISNMSGLNTGYPNGRVWVPLGAKYMALSGPAWYIKDVGIQNPTYDIRAKIREVSKAQADSELEVYDNYFDESRKTDNKYMGRDGWAVPGVQSDFFLTDYIPVPYQYRGKKDIPVRYAMGLTLKNDNGNYTWGANARQVAFYNKHNVTLSVWNIGDDGDSTAIREVPVVYKSVNNQDVIDEDNTAAFVRFCFKKSGEDRYMATFNTNRNMPSYAPYEPKIHGKLLPALYKTITNSDAAVTNLIMTGLDYAYNPEIGYGSNHTLFDDECGGKYPPSAWQPGAYTGTKYQMDCSAFSEACLKGITFANSRYISGSTRNFEAPNAYRFDSQVWDDIFYDDGNHDGLYERIYANEQAEYAQKKGYLYRVERDFSNIMPGDLLFQQQGNGIWIDITNFEKIGHVVVVMDKWLKKDGKYSIRIVESSTIDSDSGVNFRTVDASDGSAWVWGARYPLADAFFDFRKISGSFTPETVSFSLTSTEQRVKVLQLPITENLRTKMCYTLMFKGEYEDDIFFEYWIGNHDGYSLPEYSVGASGSNILMRPDRIHTVHIQIPQNITINDGSKFELAIRKASAGGTTTGSVRITDARLYEGFITGNMMI